MGSGGGLLKTIENGVKGTVDAWRENPFRELTKLATMGHYNSETGKWNEGFVLHALDEGVGEISGRNRARLQGYQTQKDIDAANAAATKQQADTQLQNFRSDLVASRAAAGVRDTANARAGGGINPAMAAASAVGAGNRLGGDERTVLGV